MNHIIKVEYDNGERHVISTPSDTLLQGFQNKMISMLLICDFEEVCVIANCLSSYLNTPRLIKENEDGR